VADVSQLPEGWRRLSSKALDDWLNTIDPRDDSLDAEMDEVFAELEARDASPMN